MNITFFENFKKRVNSTRTPSATDPPYNPHTLTGTLKEPCSILNPVISIQTVPTAPAYNGAPTSLTYAYIPAFRRYYFVTDWTWNTGLWTASLACDVLASYKSDIGTTSAYIERSAAASNGKIIDKLYPAKDDYTISTINVGTLCPWTGLDVDMGCYVLGIISKSVAGNTGGAVQYYALTQTQINNLLTYMLNDQFYNDAGFQNNAQVSRDLAKCIVNPIQYITSCMWFPTDVSSFTVANDTTIQVGPWTTIGTGKPILGDVGYRTSFRTTLPTHPDALTRGEYLNYPPFTTYYCMLPPFGAFLLDPAYMQQSREIEFSVSVDGITGKAALQVAGKIDQIYGASDYFYLSSAMFGVPIQLSQITTDYIKGTSALVNVGTHALTTVASAVSGNIPGAIAGGLMTIGSIGNALETAMPQAVSDGVNGSFLAFARLIGSFPVIVSKFTKIVDEDNTEMGRPLCEVRTINTLPGFIRCGDAHVDFAGAFTEEKNRILNFMLSGFFWE